MVYSQFPIIIVIPHTSIILYLNKFIFRLNLHLLVTGSMNTTSTIGQSWPIMRGCAVDLLTGKLVPATFSYHGPDTDIRSLRLHNSTAGILNIYDNIKRCIVLPPFNFKRVSDADLWLLKDDTFLLEHCSTSPEVELPSFCSHIRSVLKRMISEEPLFPSGLARVYKLDESNWEWSLENKQKFPVERVDCLVEKRWNVKDFLAAFKC